MWQSAVAAHFERERADHPLPSRDRLSATEEFQLRIVGGSLVNWLERYGPQMLKEREFLRELNDVDSSPDIVFISTVPGLVAANEILDPRPPSIFFFSQEEFSLFLKENPDPTFRWHVTYTSYFHELLDADILARASQKYKLRSKEEFWLHRESSMLGQLFGRGGDHLWKWNGRKPALLEEGFNTWIS